jgi:hypothetical protein
MSIRYLVLLAFLGLVCACAGLLALGWPIWWLVPVRWLSHYPLFHLVAHSTIFAGVVFLYPREHDSLRLWGIVLSGGILIELMQIGAGGFSLTEPLLRDSLFDIVVDVAGAVACWLLLAQRRHRRLMGI